VTAMLFITVFVGMLWTVDTFAMNGRLTQASKDASARLYKQTEYEIWKLKFYYLR
jgi:hypothetical protein